MSQIFPWILFLLPAFIAFDIWRAFEPSDTLGRPWLWVDRNERPAAFWAAQAFRALQIVAFLVILSLWILSAKQAA